MTQFENLSKNFNLSKNQQFAVLGQAKKSTQKKTKTKTQKQNKITTRNNNNNSKI